MPREWSIKEIRDLVEEQFNKCPCWYQIKVALALHARNNVVGCAATGAGKTLSFWIALLMALKDREEKMIFVVTPLNLLGKQNITALDKAGLKSIAVSSENVNATVYKDIEDGRYQVVIINPELLMGNDNVTKLWMKSKVRKCILYFTFDEGHCISQWGKFRKEYLLVGDLHYLISEDIPFYVTSATLPPTVLLDITEILHLPEMCLMVHGLTFAANRFKDLSFLIPQGYKDGDPPIPKFLIFFNNTKETKAATYHDDELEAMQDSDTWGLCCTDVFGMGMDLPGIDIVVQWKAKCDLCTLWQ
ncbi:P-loop containing nucleoside triphosphate hydrolase protein [Collybia nuda]|uniref:DNA 3'-5' helicase n=1 Tax=Collybia nuda TaxID=64659 RepID=A0A9P6CIT2_9AGAR|nr:P-loop containing nucleoside triphosphate hydrolase protein [Collybia nuda]